MLNGDKLCRSALYPRCAKNGVFDEAALLQFSDVNRDGKTFALSLASRFILKTVDEAHGYGRRTATRANDGIKQRNGGEDPNEDERVHYLGFYDMYYGDLQKVSLEHYRSNVRWYLENGEQAHFQMEWHLQTTLAPGNRTDKALRKDRSIARTVMASFLIGPFEDPVVARVADFDLPTLPKKAA